MKKKKKSIRYDKYGYLFLIPYILCFLAFGIYPNIYTIFLSFTDMSGLSTEFGFVGIGNYIWLWSNQQFWNSLLTTVTIWIINFIPQLGCALLFAALFTNKMLKVRGKGFFKVVYYMPNIITATAVALLFASLFGHPYGTFTVILRDLGIISEKFQFLRSRWGSRLIVCFIQWLMFTGPLMVLLIAAMAGINESLYEAATLDGATNMRMFWSITLPLIKPIMLYSLITSMIGGLQVFDIPWLFNSGGPDFATQTIALFNFQRAFSGEENLGIAAAGGEYLLFITAIASVAIFKTMYFRKEKDNG